MGNQPLKLTVCFERRPDGGLRAWSDQFPELVLSHSDIDGVLDDVPAALSVILSHRFNAKVNVVPLRDVREVLEDNGVIAPKGFVPAQREYVANCA